MHDFHYFLYLGCLFTHMNIIIQVSQHSFNFFFNLSNTMLTSALKLAGWGREAYKRIREWLQGWIKDYILLLGGGGDSWHIFSSIKNGASPALKKMGWGGGTWHILFLSSQMCFWLASVPDDWPLFTSKKKDNSVGGGAKPFSYS